VDVDTGAYANIRRMLENGNRPPSEAVRVEELINYFDYDYPLPERGSAPFSVTTRVAGTPWNQDTRLLEVGLQGWEPQREAMPANLVFLVDVSGSMGSAKKLPLLRTALKLLVDNLDRRDRVAIVTYAGQARTVLEPSPGDRDGRIKRVIDGLRANGSTNGGAGIRRAYELAERAYREEGINRVILASDGDFNTGTVDFEALIDLVEERREAGIALTTLGFGSGNYNDRLVEQLADNGDGNHAYIDSLSEARRVLVANYAANMQTIAEDVKIQIEFNPNVVSQYRLIGYRNRQLAREDFRDDAVDAGEIGAGHTVTALYEIAPRGSEPGWREPLRYEGASAHRRPVPPETSEIAFLKLRYKRPGAENSRLIEQAIQRSEPQPLTQADEDLRFATAVAGFGQLLQGGEHINGFGYQAVQELARGARGDDPHGRRSEFLELVELADALDRTDGGHHRRYSQQGTD
jgi:Ca-activated chloride channel family protein